MIVENIFKQEMCPVDGFGYDFGDITLKWRANGLRPVRLHLYGQLREGKGTSVLREVLFCTLWLAATMTASGRTFSMSVEVFHQEGVQSYLSVSRFMCV